MIGRWQGARSGLIALAMIGFGGAGFAADERADPFAELMACRNLTDAQAKAACYDLAVDNLTQARAENRIVAVTAGEVAELERDAFGFSMPSLPKIILPKLGGSSVELKEVVFAVRSARKRANGTYRFAFENGQVWIQTEKRRFFPPRQTPFDVEIKRGTLGSYLMRIKGKGVWIRVKRET